MRKFYACLVLLALTFTTFAQTPVITSVVDACGSDGKFVEIYVSGTVDLSDYKLVRRSNANPWTSGVDIDLSALGSRTDEFVYVGRDIPTLTAEFPSAGISASNAIEDGSVSHNGDDSYRLVEIAGDVVIDQFGADIDGSGEPWEYVDTWVARNDGEGPNASFTLSEWSFGSIDDLDAVGLCNDPANPTLETVATSVGTYTPPATGPTVSAPMPTENAADVVSIYSDAYTDLPIANYDPNWGQSGHTQVNTMFDPTGNGTDFVMAYPNFNYQGTDFGSNEDLSDMDYLHVDIWVPAGTDRMVKVSPINNGTGPGEVLVEVPVTPGSWNSVMLPKSDFTDGAGNEMTWDSVFQLKFDGQFNADGTANTTPFDIYVDNIYFSQEPSGNAVTTFDFENGLPSGWSTVDESSVGFDWEITDGTPDFNFQNSFSGQLALIDSDAAGFGAGNVHASLISGPIDVSSFNNGVILSFDHMYRHLNSSAQVSVSTDGGATYTLINEYTTTQGSNSGFSPVDITPVTAEFNITSEVGSASDIQIKFEYDDLDNWAYYWMVDNITVENAPSCIEPDNLAASNPSTDAIDLTWDEESPSTATNGYEWVVMASGDAADPANAVETGTVANGTLNADVTGLTPNTDYDAYVRSVCDAASNEVSAWSDIASFSTLCTPFTAPYSENFDSNGGNPIPDNGDLPDCWSGLINDASGTATLEIDDGGNNGAPTPFSAPNHVEITTDDTDDSVALISPEFSDLGDQDKRIRFYAQRDDHAGDLLIGTMTDPSDISTFTLFETITNSQLEEDTWNEFTVSFDTYTGGSAHIVFLQEEPNAFSDTYVDNFVYEQIPSCIEPDNLVASNASTDGIDLSWDEESPSTATDGYEWVVMASDDAPDTANAVVTGTEANGTLTANVTGLAPDTAYDAYVRSVCDAGSNEVSAWSGLASFTTLCSAFTAPYSENFDGVASPAIPNCFSTVGNQASEVTTEESQLGLDDPPSGNNFVLFEDDFNLADGEEAILVSPQFSDLPDADNRIRFKAAFEDGDAEDHKFFVGVMSDPTDVTTFVEVSVVTSSTDGSFVEYTVELSDPALIGSSEYIAIAGGSVAGFDEIALDDFVYEEIPSCDIPSNFQANNVTENSIDLSWDAPSPAPANGYDWEIVPAGDGQGNNVVASGNEASTSVTAMGLSANTFYDAYVRSNCGSGDGESIYIGSVNFRTAPQTAQGLTCSSGGDSSVVFSEEFNDNNAGWTGDVGSGNDNWEIPDDAGSSNTGADSAFSGSNYMNFEASNTSSSEGSIVSPAIDLSSGQAEAELSFWMHAYGADMGTLEVGVGTSATGPFTNEFTWSGQLQTAGDDAWVNVGVNLDAYVGQTIYIELTQIDDGTSFEGDMSIDLFEVSTCTSCAVPSNLTVSNITASSADLSWDAVPTATDGYEWVVMASTDAPDPANAIETGTVANGTLTANVTGLGSSTEYDAYVRSVCDAGSNVVSSWSDIASFSTLCLTFDTFPFVEDFEDDSTSLSCWSQIQEVGSANWTFEEGSSGGNISTANSGTQNARFVSQSGDFDPITKLVSPVFDLTSLNNPELSFFYGQEVWFGDQNELKVYYKVDDQSAWVEIAHFTDNVDDWTEESIILPNPSATYQIAFEGINDFGRANVIDDVEIKEGPNCLKPLNLTTSNVTDNSVDLTWDEESPSTASDGYEWVVMASGDAPDTANAVETATVGNGTFTASVSNLTPESDYDAYVRSVCDAANNEVSAWTSEESFTTGIAPTIVSVGNPASETYCYDNDEFEEWRFDSDDGSPLTVIFSAGSVELNTFSGETYDDLIIYDGTDDTGAILFDSDVDGNELEGLSFTAQSGSMYITLDSDVSNSCQDSPDIDTIEFDVYIQGDEPTASVQVIHNSPDPAAASVDVYLDGALLPALTGVNFREASAFLSAPAIVDFTVDVVPAGDDLSASVFTQTFNLAEDETYIIVADGVLDPSQFDASVNTIDFSLEVYAGAQQSSTNAGETSVLVHHGATDAPTVDVVNDADQSILVDDISYPEFQGYLDLPTQDYIINVEAADNSAVVASYEANLATLGTSDLALTVLASGFLDPAANQNGAAFGLWAALPTGGPLVELPEVQPDPASVQIIHNSADPAAQQVDVYLNGTLLEDDFAFRTATAFLDVPAETPIDIDIAPSTSSDVSESIYNLNTTLTENETYVVVANGVIDPTQFDDSVNTIDFGLNVFAGAQQASTNAGETSVLVNHGSTDAPTVDIVNDADQSILVDDISYPEFQGYLDLPTQDYTINVEAADNSAVVASYEANLATLGTSDLALTVLASGFLDPAANQNGAAFGLWAALPTGGPLVELPEVEPAPMAPAPDPTEDPTDVISMFSGVYTDVVVDTWLTPWSSAQLADIQIQGNDTKLYTDLDFAGVETVTNPIDASGMDFFHIDVWSPNATTFRVKLVDLGAGVEGELAFTIAQEQWVSLQIPLGDFADPALVTDPNNLLTSTSSIQQLIISGLPVGDVTAYVDNVYFSTDGISTSQFDKSNFNYYPNPVVKTLNINTNDVVENVEIFNILGQKVIDVQPDVTSPQINMGGLQAGAYMMRVTIDGVSQSFRVIKK